MGGLSAVCVGDPAQCEAIFDDQMYDRTPHKTTVDHTDAARLSNRGMDIYAGFDEVVVLTTCHRLRFLDKDTLTEEEKAYNDRAARFMKVLHGLRDLTWTLEDYYWLCKRKKSNLTITERASFHDAPVIMEFRRQSDDNPENNCQAFNRAKLLRHARERKVPVVRFDAQHEGVEHADGMNIGEEQFGGLASTLELSEGARVIITNNLAVDHGLMNGTQGIVK